MNIHRFINWFLALAIVGLYAAMSLLDGPSIYSYEMKASEDLQNAINSVAAEARFAMAAAKICGNGAYRQTDGGALVCINRKTRKESM